MSTELLPCPFCGGDAVLTRDTDPSWPGCPLCDVWLESVAGWNRRARPSRKSGKRPEIVCLCGSTRFYREYQIANYELTMQGAIVLSVGFYPHSREHHEEVGITNAGYPTSKKDELDELHLRKIDLADRIVVVAPGGYIGDSTRNEITYAQSLGKPVEIREDFSGKVEGATETERRLLERIRELEADRNKWRARASR